jgi:PAS domain S-box-containing protein
MHREIKLDSIIAVPLVQETGGTMSNDSENASVSSGHAHTLAALIEASDDAIISQALDGIILSWNRGAERIYGYTAEEAVGRPISFLTRPEYGGEPDPISESIARDERVDRFEANRITKDGRFITVSISVSPAKDDSGRIIGTITISRDVTDQRQAQQELSRLTASSDNRRVVLDTANRVALDILSSRTGVEALRHIADAARTLSGAQYAALGVASHDGKSLDEFVTVGLTPQQEAAIGPRPKGIGVLGHLLTCPDPLRISRLQSHASSRGFPPNHPHMDSFLGVPIRRGQTVLGSLYLTNKRGADAFTEADELAVLALGSHAAVAIHNLQMLSRQRSLVSGLIRAQEEERRAVAYDLHDGLTQFVMASHAHLESFRRAYSQDNAEKAERELEQGLRYLKEAVVESRRLVNGLRSLALDDLGLAGALEQLVAEEKARAQWAEAEFIHNIAERRYDKGLEAAAYRVIQEALTNVRKHAQAKKVRVVLLEDLERPDGPVVSMEVRDWGVGFVPEEAARLEAHVGLQGMIERVSLMDGTFEVISAPGEGAIIRAVIPIIENCELEEEGNH